jgi:hypothetical protein
MIGNNGLQLFLPDHSISTFKFACVRSHRGSKKKVVEKISTYINRKSSAVFLCLEILLLALFKIVFTYVCGA